MVAARGGDMTRGRSGTNEDCMLGPDWSKRSGPEHPDGFSTGRREEASTALCPWHPASLPAENGRQQLLIDFQLQLQSDPAFLQRRTDRLRGSYSRNECAVDAAKMLTDGSGPRAGQRLQILLGNRFQRQQNAAQRFGISQFIELLIPDVLETQILEEQLRGLLIAGVGLAV